MRINFGHWKSKKTNGIVLLAKSREDCSFLMASKDMCLCKKPKKQCIEICRIFYVYILYDNIRKLNQIQYERKINPCVFSSSSFSSIFCLWSRSLCRTPHFSPQPEFSFLQSWCSPYSSERGLASSQGLLSTPRRHPWSEKGKMFKVWINWDYYST